MRRSNEKIRMTGFAAHAAITVTVLATWLLAAACGGPAPLDAANYDRSCEKASDCVVVFIGDCSGGGCTCPNVAISRHELAHYEHDFAEQGCDGPACPCVAEAPTCEHGTCAAGHP